MITIALAAALLLQQPAPQRPNREAAQAASRQAITDLGRRVGEARSRYELFRRAVYNLPDAMVVQRGDEMRQACQDLEAAARETASHLCRGCFGARAQQALDRYRAALPTVSQVGRRCATQLAQPVRAADPAAIKRTVDQVGRTVSAGLFPYEARISDIRQAFGIEAPPEKPRR